MKTQTFEIKDPEAKYTFILKTDEDLTVLIAYAHKAIAECGFSDPEMLMDYLEVQVEFGHAEVGIMNFKTREVKFFEK